jgi:hypothetical protein
VLQKPLRGAGPPGDLFDRQGLRFAPVDLVGKGEQGLQGIFHLLRDHSSDLGPEITGINIAIGALSCLPRVVAGNHHRNPRETPET